jgi:hypothetical protein
MQLGLYLKLNEKIKGIISQYQLNSKFEINELEETHKNLVSLIAKKPLYEDLKIGLINAYNELLKGNTDFLAKNDASYHLYLWRLHQRIINEKKKLKIGELPEELRKFNRILHSKKAFFREGSIYYIVSLIGSAKGHITSVKTDDATINLEYNDHCIGRLTILRKRLEKKGWVCTYIKVLEDIFPKKEASKNYFFTALKQKQKGDLETLAWELAIGIDTDWIIVDELKEWTDEEMENEIRLVETAYMLWDIFKIKPRDFLQIVRSTIRISLDNSPQKNCRRMVD